MKNKFLGIIYLLYFLIIVYVFFTDQLKNYLAPSMQIYIKIIIIPLVLIGFIMIFGKLNHYKFKFSDLVLLIPIIFIFLSGDGRLTSSFASNRSSSINNEYRTKTIEKNTDNMKEVLTDIKDRDNEIEENTNDDSKELSDYDFSHVYFDVIDTTYNELANYLTFASNASKYEGETIRVKGFALKEASQIPDGYFGIGKYAISCCAADANFTGFIVKYDNNLITNDKWYEVEGVLEKGKDREGYAIAFKILKEKTSFDINCIEKGHNAPFPI